MSIWNDMLKFNVKNKRLTASYNSGDSNSHRIDISVPIELYPDDVSSEFIKIAEFIPKIGGTIHDMYFYFSKITDGTELSHAYIQIRDKTGNIIKNSGGIVGQSDFSILNIPVKAFNKYDIFFKEYRPNANSPSFRISEINIYYGVSDMTNHIITSISL